MLSPALAGFSPWATDTVHRDHGRQAQTRCGAVRLISAKPSQARPSPLLRDAPSLGGMAEAHVRTPMPMQLGNPAADRYHRESGLPCFIGDQIPNKKPPISSFVIFRTDSQYMHQRNPA
ncbi:hypothetical protein CTATCC11996_18327 [Comamonas testosteroni ATCC 11996]|nr:hypothetical protein CTATCC11996_18327 [Comamonas testosteroni ATCC 11996]